MSYTPTNWKDGDLVTSAKLNKLEQGVANAGGANILVARMETTIDDEPIITKGETIYPDPIITLDKTLQEIMDADLTIIKDVGPENKWIGTDIVRNIYFNEQYFEIETADNLLPVLFATNLDDYPTSVQPASDK